MSYTTEEIAKMCHEANKHFTRIIGDFSQDCWEEAPQWQRESAVKGVEFNLANPTAPASASHESWLEEKRLTGWKYGPVKDAEKREHPCYVEYQLLPKDQRTKDHLFKAIVAAMSATD